MALDATVGTPPSGTAQNGVASVLVTLPSASPGDVVLLAVTSSVTAGQPDPFVSSDGGATADPLWVQFTPSGTGVKRTGGRFSLFGKKIVGGEVNPTVKTAGSGTPNWSIVPIVVTGADVTNFPTSFVAGSNFLNTKDSTNLFGGTSPAAFSVTTTKDGSLVLRFVSDGVSGGVTHTWDDSPAAYPASSAGRVGDYVGQAQTVGIHAALRATAGSTPDRYLASQSSAQSWGGFTIAFNPAPPTPPPPPLTLSDIAVKASTNNAGGARGTTLGTGSSTTITTLVNSLFPKLTQQQRSTGYTDYVCIYVENDNANFPAGVVASITTQPTEPSVQIKVAAGSATAGTDEGTTPPATSAFAASADLGALAATKYKALWFQRAVASGSPAIATHSFVASLDVSPA